VLGPSAISPVNDCRTPSRKNCTEVMLKILVIDNKYKT
jgi:hypothetical protein